MTEPVPSLYEYVGGQATIEHWFEVFYAKVPSDPLLGPVFADMPEAHARHVAAFVAEVLGGPSTYSARHGGHPHMVRRHLGRALTERQRKRWVELLLECADEISVPDDPEFRSALVSYLEWGSRLARQNSQPGAIAADPAPMPKWGWGEAKGPYRP